MVLARKRQLTLTAGDLLTLHRRPAVAVQFGGRPTPHTRVDNVTTEIERVAQEVADADR